MKWIKQGKILEPAGEFGWMNSHAQGPTVLVRDNFLRIYFTSRPEPTISLPTFIDVDIDDPKRILAFNEQPLLEMGARGSFDEFGVQTAEVVEVGDEIWLYYTGWDRGTTVTYRLAVGLAISRDGGRTFHKAYHGPVLDRTNLEPFLTCSPVMVRENGRWHAWYGSGIGYHATEGKYEPQYIIKYATSSNGIDWERPNITCIKPKSELESNTRPSVIKINNTYHMWFSYRDANDFRGGTGSYRIGYASSTDRINWDRDDSRAGIDVSEEGWDSALITYPYVKKIRDRYLMFYNGNGFGASGFGYAIADWENEDAGR